MLGIKIRVLRSLAQHTVGFSAATGTAEEHLKDGAFKQRHLRRVAAR